MIEVGKKAPAFTLESSDGGKVKLADLAGKVVVLYFYPRDNTPGCTVEAEGFRDAMPALKKLGATVLGVSKDSIASHCKFRDKYKLTFPLLSDPDGKVLEALQELTRLAVYRETGERSRLMLDVSGFRADKRARLSQLGSDTAARVAESSEPVSLEPMSPFERKIVHDAVAAAGLRSESAGVEPRRYVVVLPADA